MSNTFRHLRTIFKHRHQVIRNGFHMGIFWQCLRHDLSKYGPLEFGESKKHYRGIGSPVVGDRAAHDYYSKIAIHHTGKNKHHWEYWVDFFQGRLILAPMPWKYATEMVCDMLSASKTYDPKHFSGHVCLEYFQKRKAYCFIHKATEEYLEWCFAEYGNNGWKNLKRKLTKKKYAEIQAKYPKVQIIEKLYDLEPLADLSKYK